MKKFFCVLFFVFIFASCGKKPLTVERLPYDRVWNFYDGLALARIPNEDNGGNRRFNRNYLYGFINEEGVWVIPPQFTRIDEGQNYSLPSNRPYFSEGLAAAAIYDEALEIHVYGYIDTNGEWIIEPQYGEARNFRDGMAWVLYMRDCENVEWGQVITRDMDNIEISSAIIDRDFNYIIEPGRYLYIGGFLHDSFTVSSMPIEGDDFGFWGLVDINGTEIVPLSMELRMVVPFAPLFDGMTTVQSRDWKWGVINRELEIIIPFISDRQVHFSEGLFRICIDGAFGYVDINNQWIIEPQFEDATSFSEGFAAVKVGELWTYINRTGEIIMPPIITQRPPMFSDGLAEVRIDGRTVTINTSGEIVD
jgi:hypothetical protein